MLAILHHFKKVFSMAEIVSKEAQKKLKAGICFRFGSVLCSGFAPAVELTCMVPAGSIVPAASSSIVLPAVRHSLDNIHRQQQQVPPHLVETPKDTMADNRTMAELLQSPTEGYEDAIVVSEIEAANFEIKHGLLTLVQNKQFFGT
ncbi:hypothetical protein Tco_0689733 [Tanacetum coccineum]